MKKKFENKTATDRTRKKGRDQTNYRRNRKTREQQSSMSADWNIWDFCFAFFPLKSFFFSWFFLNSRDDSFDPDAACCWWFCCDQRNLLSKTLCGLLLQTGIKPPGLYNPEKITVREQQCLSHHCCCHQACEPCVTGQSESLWKLDLSGMHHQPH